MSYLATDLGASKECFRIRNRCSSARVKGSFIPTVCKELATLACRSEVSDLSLSDGTDLIMQCLLRTAPLCLLFLLVCPLGSQRSLQCLRLADQHAHLSDRSAGNSGELQQCWQAFFLNHWCLQEKKHRSVCIALEPSSRYPAGSTEKQDPWLGALDPALAPAWLNPRLPAGVLAVSKILSNRLLFERRA